MDEGRGGRLKSGVKERDEVSLSDNLTDKWDKQKIKSDVNVFLLSFLLFSPEFFWIKNRISTVFLCSLNWEIVVWFSHVHDKSIVYSMRPMAALSVILYYSLRWNIRVGTRLFIGNFQGDPIPIFFPPFCFSWCENSHQHSIIVIPILRSVQTTSTHNVCVNSGVHSYIGAGAYHVLYLD